MDCYVFENVCKIFKEPCKVGYCNSVKSKKYICKNVTKVNDMPAFGLQASDLNDEIMDDHLYVRCTEALNRIYTIYPKYIECFYFRPLL